MITLVHLTRQTYNIKIVSMSHSVSLNFDRHEMMGWIERVVNFGIRRPGLKADRDTEDFIIDSLHSFGIDQVITQTVKHSVWDENKSTVSCWPTSDSKKAASFKALGVPYTIPTSGYTGELLVLDNLNTPTPPAMWPHVTRNTKLNGLSTSGTLAQYFACAKTKAIPLPSSTALAYGAS